MKRFFAILLFTIMCSNSPLYSQLINKEYRENKATERDVKTSGDYYYGEGSDKVEEQALSIALDDLKLMFLEARMSSSDSKFLQVDFQGLERAVSTITFEALVTGRVKVLAYITKETMNAIADGTIQIPAALPPQQETVVASVSAPAQQTGQISAAATGPAVVQVSTQPSGVVTPEMAALRNRAPSSTTTAATSTAAVVASNSVAANQANQAAHASQAAQANQVSQDISTLGVTPPSQSVSAPVEQTSAPVSAPSSTIGASRVTSVAQGTKTGEPIIDQLLDVTIYEEARQILNQYKSSGKLMYGQLATMTNPQNCYFLVLRNREIVDILDKAPTADRQSLRTGRRVNYKETPETILWIYIL